MESMIYYPGFELKNSLWLKFALLYFDELRPVIPDLCVSEEMHLSSTARRIMSETNLIRPYHPHYEDSIIASSVACREFDEFMRNPGLYTKMFNHPRSTDPRNYWQNPDYQTCNLYYGKFSDEFFNYCLDNKLATKFEYGIRLNKELAFVYMSFLADVISKKEQAEMFTDETRYNILLEKNDLTLSKDQELKIKLIRTYIEAPFPENARYIPLNKFIELRSNKYFEECRIEFVKQMDEYIKLRDKNYNLTAESVFNPTNDIIHILCTALGALGTIYLTGSSIVSPQSKQSSVPFAFASAFAGIPAIEGIREAPEYFNKIRSKIHARRYIAMTKR